MPRRASNPPPGLVYIQDSADGTPGIARRLGITPGTYRKWRMSGKGPETFLLAGAVVARTTAVDAYIAEQEQAGRARRSVQCRPPEPRVSRGVAGVVRPAGG